MRRAIYHALTSDARWTDLVPVTYERGAVPDSPALPFAVLAWGGSTRLPGNRVTYDFTLWCYDNRGDYTKIDEALAAAAVILDGVVDYDYDGQHVGCVVPQGDSGDLYDDVYRANARNSGYRVVGSGL